MRIIVFENDKLITPLLRSALVTKGHNVIAFSNQVACFTYACNEDCCKKGSPCGDVIISDHIMPKMSGDEFFKFQRNCGCKALDENKALISDSKIHDGLNYGAKDSGYHYIKKPFKISEILKWVDECEERIKQREIPLQQHAECDRSTDVDNSGHEVKRLRAELRVYCMQSDQTMLTGFSIDISTGGLFLKTNHPFAVDEDLELKFTLPGQERAITCKARVAWLNLNDKRQKPELPVGIGLQFVDMSLDVVKSIRRFLNHNEIVPTW